MAQTSYKGAIGFGLVHIPISLYTAAQDNDIQFNQLCKEDGSRVQYKRTCRSCGKEVGPGDIVRGFEFESGRYVVITDEDLDKIKTPKDKRIEIDFFTALENIPPIYFDKTYHCIPDSGGEKSFELLRQVMLEQKLVAIGKSVLHDKEKLLCLIPTANGMLIETMFFLDEIRAIPKEHSRPELTEAEKNMASQLMESMKKEFTPAAYHDDYQERLRELIARKANDQEILVPAAEQESNVIDIMEALRLSLEKTKPSEKPKRRRSSKGKGA